MMRLVLACILFAGINGLASAQSFAGFQATAPIAAPSYTGPGDIVSGATAFYGLRAFNAAIAAAGTQKLINIRNTATAETCDVIVATTGGFGNVANCSGSSSGDSVATFCALSGGPCAVTEAYDQTGNGNNVTQGTTSQQPALVLGCINSLPCMQFTGSATQTLTGSIGTAAQPFTLSAVGETTHSTNNDVLIGSRSSFPDDLFIQDTFSQGPGLTLSTTAIQVAGGAANTWYAIQGIGNGASSVVNVNGTEQTGSASQTLGVNINLGSYGGGGNPLTGKLTEGGAWPSGFSPTARTNICRNQQAYYGATNFGASC